MVALIIFTKLMDALVRSYTNLDKEMPKNGAIITRKKDDATVKLVKAPSVCSSAAFKQDRPLSLMTSAIFDLKYDAIRKKVLDENSN